MSLLSIDAAGIAADARLIEHLERFRADLSLEEDASFKSALDDAIRACRGRPNKPADTYGEPCGFTDGYLRR